ncbi:tetratricopeptide repeat protein [Leptospira santarosai]|uniref:tetratricopeptide repeat protein n=1 Tax=Leptospira santarosai TaxID=28183 RepID=UPI0024AEC18C|nr:tetratricopeptide repeat protein [Leptospira santarosai]MDI7209557.1 tetratricopeptide repeat protein [Leptospira santarosai]MDI7213394.1 tetratricopeptide repeat protein [Leptospira santarosai]MDI7220826.1 tetratricopeptide repeat protein [Leptospira santarosai]
MNRFNPHLKILLNIFLVTIGLFFSIANCNKKESVPILEIRDLTEKENLMEALQKTEKNLKLKGDTAELLYIRGWIRYLQKNQIAAMNDFKKCLTLDPKSLDCKRGLGLIYESNKDYKEAATVYQEALVLAKEKGPDFEALIHENIGILYLRQNLRKESLSEFQNAISLSDKGDAYYGFSLCLIMEGNWNEAIPYLEKGISKSFRAKAFQSESHFLLSKFYFEKRKDPVKAEAEIKKAIEIFPLHKEYLDALQIYLKGRVKSDL